MQKIWIPGAMPVEFLLLLSLGFFVFVIANRILRQHGMAIPTFWQAVLIWLTAYITLKWVLFPPIPSALLKTYMGLITFVVFLLVSSDDDSWEECKQPIIGMLAGLTPTYRMARAVTFVALPGLVAWGTWDTVLPKFPEPIELRTSFPAPPASVNVHGETYTLQMARNPFRVDREGNYSARIQEQHLHDNPWADNAPAYMQHVRDGGAIYFQNCLFCHGANLDGRGIFAFAFNPIPANFTDPGTIAQLQESYNFWRVATGGMGLPREGFPWASVMPPFEQHLSSDEMWKAILFEYWHTGFFPRT